MAVRSRVRRKPAAPSNGKNGHLGAMRISSELTQIYRRMYKPAAAMISPEDVIRVLNRAKIGFVLMGTHGISGWRGEPRATQDVDVLVRKSHHRKAIKAIQKAYPELQSVELPVVTRFLDPLDGKPVIDLMKPEEPLYQEVFRAPVPVGKTHHVPNLEMALACKYAAMVSPLRAAVKKALDEADFISIVQSHADEISNDVLFSLGEMAKNGGGPEVLRLVETAKAGRRLDPGA